MHEASQARRVRSARLAAVLAISLVLGMAGASPANARESNFAPNPSQFTGAAAAKTWYQDVRFYLASGYKSADGIRISTAMIVGQYLKINPTINANIEAEIARFGHSQTWRNCAAFQLSWSAYRIAKANSKISHLRNYYSILSKAPLRVPMKSLVGLIPSSTEFTAGVVAYNEGRTLYMNLMECS